MGGPTEVSTHPGGGGRAVIFANNVRRAILKFALQLDTCPITDRSCQTATDNPDEGRFGVVLARSSHAVRLIDPLESANLRVVDSTVSGFCITEQSVADITADLAGKVADLDPSKNIVLVQLLDNSCFECRTPEGDRILPKRGRDGKYVEGRLRMIGKDTLREHFLTLQPQFKVVKNFKVIVLLTPMPRYLWNRCCTDRAHITNSESENFATDMGNSIRELNVNLRNMVFMRKLKGVSVLNTVEALGISPGGNSDRLDLDRILALWGANPVHSTAAAYHLLVEKVM